MTGRTVSTQVDDLGLISGMDAAPPLESTPRAHRQRDDARPSRRACNCRVIVARSEGATGRSSARWWRPQRDRQLES